MINRLKKIIAENDLTSSKFADEIGVQRSSISHILSGRNKPSLEFVQKILNRYPEIKSEWLLSGKGQMKNISNSDLFSQEHNPKTNEIVTSSKINTENKEEKEVNKSSEEKNVNVIPERFEPSKIQTSKSKTVEKVIVFYTDNTFDAYEPSKMKE